MRTILGSLSLIAFLVYPALAGFNYNLPEAVGYSGYTPGYNPIYAHPTPEVYPIGDHGLLNTVNPYIGGDYGFAGGYTGAPDYAFAPPVVSKYFSYHSAPEEPQEVNVRHLAIGEPRKTYRVVFIRAPVQNPPVTRITASFAPKEEKTVIYVLSKKPETQIIEEIVQPDPTEPSKPEVVFVKYKTQEEAIHAQRTIQAQYDALGGSTQVSDEGIAPLTSVEGSLGQSVEGSLGHVGHAVHAGHAVHFGQAAHAGYAAQAAHAGQFGHAGHFGNAGHLFGAHSTTENLLHIQPTTESLVHVVSTRSPKFARATPRRR